MTKSIHHDQNAITEMFCLCERYFDHRKTRTDNPFFSKIDYKENFHAFENTQ